MTNEQRLYIAKRFIEKNPEWNLEDFLYQSAIDELNYAHNKCANNHNIDYIKEFQKVLDAYVFDEVNVLPEIIAYKNFLLERGQPRWFHVGHFDINDSISYIGEYYDETSTINYRKKGRYNINPICPELLSRK